VEKRIIFFLVLSMALIVLYPYVLERMGMAKRAAPVQPKKSDTPQAPRLPPTQAVPQKAPLASEALPLAPAAPRVTQAENKEQQVTVETDLVKVVLANRGGVIKKWELKQYKTQDEKNPQPIELVPTPEKDIALVPPLTIEVSDPKLQQRLEKGLYTVSEKALVLSDAKPSGQMEFSFTDPESGVKVVKRLSFMQHRYLVDLEVETAGIPGSTTLSLGTNFGINKWEEGFVGFIGPATNIGGKLSKDTPDKEEIRTGQIEWVALQDKYFLAAAIPSETAGYQAVIRKEADKHVSVGLRRSVQSGTVSSRYRLFVGPKEYDTLAALHLQLEETIDFGWFIYGSWGLVRAVAKPLFYAIRYLHDITHNYGVAIIVVTIALKLALAPLAYKSYKSMKSMAAVQPELQALQKKHAEDRERLNKELIKLYKDKKVNPVGGCLPMFFQVPVFVALFNILYMTIELRQAPFMLWVKDLSVQDPYYVLPILMGITMFVQQKIQPTTMDPKQAQIMLILPVFLTFLFITFPAGLVLYWLTNNVLTIAQQVITDRYLLPKSPVPATT